MTHFADADGARGIAVQQAAFETATADLPGERSLANSAAVLRHPELRSDWVRPGIALYGSAPDHPEHDIAHWGLRPTMTLESRLLAVQALAVGQTVGYGSLYTAAAPLRVGVVACGYADGYPRVAPGGNAAGTPMLVDGVRTRTVGRVSMDMLAVDLTPVPAAAPGSVVTLWGEGPPRDGRPTRLPIDEVAQAAGTLGYELMCALARRVPVEAV